MRLSHTLPINSQKVANKSVKKLLKSCYFFYLFALEVGVVAIFTGRICLDFSFSTKVAENIFKSCRVSGFALCNCLNKRAIFIFLSF